MARVLFFTLLAMCLVCLIQAAPGGEQPTPQANPLEALTNVMSEGWESAKTVAQNIANGPTVQKGFQDAAKLILQAADAVKAQVQATIPKTE